MQERPKAIIAGFVCKPPSLDYLRLPSVDITEDGPKRNLGTEALSRAEPEVRIHFPPAVSQGELETRFRRGYLANGLDLLRDIRSRTDVPVIILADE